MNNTVPSPPELLSLNIRGNSLKYYLLAALVIVTVVILLIWLTKDARQTLISLRQTERSLHAPRMRFLEAAPQFHRPFMLAKDRNFLIERSTDYASPALSYLDKKGVSTEKLVERYENFWRLLEELQLKQDFAFEEIALRAFLTASSSEVRDAMGDRQDIILAFEGIDRYKFLSEQGLAWYLQHYYIDPATALTKAHQYGKARQLIYDALRRLQFRSIALSRYLKIPEYDRIMLLAAVYAVPDALIGRDDELDLILKIVGDDFPPDARFDLEAHNFPTELKPLKQHLLGIYDMRNHDYAAAESKFTWAAEAGQQNYLRDLSFFMVIRSRFWKMRENLIRNKTTLQAADAKRFASGLEDYSQKIRPNNLRANVREYIALVKSDFTNKKALTSEQRKQDAPHRVGNTFVPASQSGGTEIPITLSLPSPLLPPPASRR